MTKKHDAAIGGRYVPTFQEYSHASLSEDEITSFEKTINQSHGLSYYLLILCKHVCGCQNLQLSYFYLQHGVSKLYQLYKRKHTTEHYSIVSDLMECFWDLDIACGVNDNIIERCKNNEKEALDILDSDRQKFRDTFVRSVNKLRNCNAAIATLTLFAEYIFILNCYELCCRQHTAVNNNFSIFIDNINEDLCNRK